MQNRAVCKETGTAPAVGAKGTGLGPTVGADFPAAAFEKKDSSMPIHWYFTQDGPTLRGPVTGRALKHLASTGRLLPTHRVRKEGMISSVEARRVKGLFPPLEADKA